ncbi:MAG: tetratricopeptide repeat protein [Caulobacter sp.]|nr:tetratricopeptide repeat protein [Caulobacter sp.]
MRLSRVAGVLAGLTVAATASQAGAQSFSRRIDLLRLQDEAVATAAAVFQSSGKSCGVEFARLRTLYADPRFDRMAVDTRRTALFAMMVCAESRDLPFAVHAARRLEPIAVAPMEVSTVHSVQISEALQRGAESEAARLFLSLADKQPRLVADWDPEMVSPFADYLEDDPDLSLKVAERLSTLDWTNDASRRAARNTWALSWGWQLADSGKLKEAGAAVDKADELYVMLMVAGDRRFSRVWDRFARERRFDWTALATARLDQATADMADNPASLRPAEEMIAALRALGRLDEAIQTGEAFRARLQDGEVFEDGDRRAGRLMIGLGQALFEAGRYGEAEAVFGEAIILGEPVDSGEVAVDARLAWAGRLLDLARPREALATLEPIGEKQVTPYGRLWVESQRACAQADLDPGAAAATIIGLEKERKENPAALSQALICTNRLDEAAALMIERLRDPRHRAGALDPYWITRGPEKVPAWQAEFERRRQTVLNNPDVLAALDVAGRKVEAPLAGDYWGGF